MRAFAVDLTGEFVACVQEQLVRMGKKSRYLIFKKTREKLLAAVSDYSAGEEESKRKSR